MKRLVNNPDWEEAKRKVRIRDGHKCQMCGTVTTKGNETIKMFKFMTND